MSFVLKLGLGILGGLNMNVAWELLKYYWQPHGKTSHLILMIVLTVVCYLMIGMAIDHFLTTTLGWSVFEIGVAIVTDGFVKRWLKPNAHWWTKPF